MTVVNTTHIYIYLFSLLYFNYLHIVTTIYIDIMTFEMCLFLWNFCDCNVTVHFYCLFHFVYYLFHLPWQCKHMIPMPIKPLNWKLKLRENKGAWNLGPWTSVQSSSSSVNKLEMQLVPLIHHRKIKHLNKNLRCDSVKVTHFHCNLGR